MPLPRNSQSFSGCFWEEAFGREYVRDDYQINSAFLPVSLRIRMLLKSHNYLSAMLFIDNG
jgi:hypothetical protein